MGFSSITSVLWRRRYVILGVLVVMLALSPLTLRALRPTYQGVSHVMLVADSKDASSLVGVSDLPDLIMSTEVITRAKNAIHLDTPVDSLRAKITAKAALKSQILPITVRDKNPRLALELPNALADSLTSYFHDVTTRQYDQLTSFLRESMSHKRNEVKQLDARLQNAVVADSFVGSDKGVDLLTARLDDLEAQRGQAFATMVADQAQATQSKQLGDMKDVVQAQVLQSDPVYQSIRAGHAKDAALLSQTRAQYTDKFPGLPGLVQQVKSEAQSVSVASKTALAAGYGASTAYAQAVTDGRHASTLVAGDQARLAALDKQLAKENQRISDLPHNGVIANALRLQRDAANADYVLMSNRLSTTLANQAQAASLNSLVVVDRATAAYPRIPQAVLAMLAALVMLTLAIGSAFAAEFLDPRIANAGDVERLYGHPIIGSLGN